MLRRIFLLFFVSGALGLGYQVLWSKLVLLFVGVSSWSYAIVLAAFMTGLALGSRFLGPVADRSRSPLSMFGWMELGVGAYAVAYPTLTELAGRAYLRLAATTSEDAGDHRHLLLKALVAGLLLIPPTFLMGGTFPALVRHASTSLGSVGRRASQLYAINAAGAVVGSLGMAMALLPALGLRGSLMVLALGNTVVGALAIVAGRRPVQADVAGDTIPEPDPATSRESVGTATASAPVHRIATASARRTARLAIAIVFVAGFLSFTLEIAWTRAFAVVMGSSTQSFAAILAAFITGIALGSFVLSRLESRIDRPIAAFGAVQIVTGLLVLLPLPLYPYLPWAIGRIARELPSTGAGYHAWGLLKLGACLAIMLLPCLGMGISIPLVVKAVSRRLQDVGADTGAVYAWNTLGNVLGATTSGMVLLPALGVERLIEWSAVALAVAGSVALAAGGPRPLPRRWVALTATGVLAAMLLPWLLPPWNPAWFSLAAFRRTQMATWSATKEGVALREIVFQRDDPAGNVMVLHGLKENQGSVALLVNGKPDASNLGDQPTQILLAHLPLLLAPGARSVLVIGLASGITSGAVLRHPVERLDVVDIIQCMPEASAYFDEWNGRPLEDPRTRFIADDARSFLVSTTQRYDVVISEPSNPWTAGTGSLFSTEFYRTASERLSPGGIYVQWLQAYELSDELLSAVLRSFRGAFEHVTLWETATNDVLLVGSQRPTRPDPARMASIMADPGIAEHLTLLGLRQPEDLMFLERFTEPTVDWIAAASRLENTDDNLLLEHEAPRDLFTLATPTLLSVLDERRAATPRLEWTAAHREGRADPMRIPHLMQTKVFGTPLLLAGWLAAVTRTQGIAFAAIPEAVRAALPANVGEPMSREALLEALDQAVTRNDLPRLTELLHDERTAIAVEAMLSPGAGEAWGRQLGDLATRANGRAAASLRLVQSEALAAAGRIEEARAALEAALLTEPPATVDEVIVRACRIDPGEPCDAFARRMLESTGDERLQEFLDLRNRD